MPWSWVMGLRSVYAKTVRDSRRAAVLVGLVAGAFMFGTGAPYGSAPEFSTLELRQQFVNGILTLPMALRGLLGEPINIEHLGGFLSWRVGNSIPLLMGLWSVVALSGTLAGESSRGSLDLLVSTPQGRRSIAIQKVAGHVTAVAAAMLLFAVITWLVGVRFASLPGDEIPFEAALGQAVLFGLLMLMVGSIAFAAAPFVGRARSLAIGLIALFSSSLIYSYASLSPTIEALGPLSWNAWTAGHRPMAGVTDWPSVGLLGIACLAVFAVGVVAFERRDLGDSNALGWLRLPSLPAGTRNAFARQGADRLGDAIGWGLGIGLYGALIVSSADAFAASIGSLPQIVALVNQLYPGIDFSQPSGILQLAFYNFGSLLMGLAAATFVAAWSSDETGGRLAVVMATPISRVRWMLQSGLGVLAAVAAMTVVVGSVVGVAVSTQGGNLGAPLAGVAILGLASAAVAGVGLAVGGLLRASLAAPAAALVAIATWLLDTLGAALELPDPILQLSLFKHLGQPMVGTYDPVGIVAAVVLAFGGLAVGAFGLQRRDLDR